MHIYITMWREELHLNTKHFTYIDNLKMVNLYIRNQQVVYILYLEGWYNRYIHIWIYKQQMVIKCRNNISNAWYRMVIPFYFPIFSYFPRFPAFRHLCISFFWVCYRWGNIGNISLQCPLRRWQEMSPRLILGHGEPPMMEPPLVARSTVMRSDEKWREYEII